MGFCSLKKKQKIPLNAGITKELGALYNWHSKALSLSLFPPSFLCNASPAELEKLSAFALSGLQLKVIRQSSTRLALSWHGSVLWQKKPFPSQPNLNRRSVKQVSCAIILYQESTLVCNIFAVGGTESPQNKSSGCTFRQPQVKSNRVRFLFILQVLNLLFYDR